MKEYPKPTLAQSIASWHIVCDLVDMGVPHNFQAERSDLRDYMYAATKMVRRALSVVEAGGTKDDRL